MRTPAQLLRDRTSEIARLKTLRSKLCGIIESADEGDEANRNGAVGNLADDIKVLAREIEQGALSLTATCMSISILADAQRQAEIDHAPLIAELKAVIAGAPANVTRLSDHRLTHSIGG